MALLANQLGNLAKPTVQQTWRVCWYQYIKWSNVTDIIFLLIKHIYSMKHPLQKHLADVYWKHYTAEGFQMAHYP